MFARALGLILAVSAAQTGAQTSDTRPRFDVASVKRNTGADRRSLFRPSPDGITATNVVPALLIADAYGVAGYQIAGAPPWMATERYDILAKSNGALTADQRMIMLQALLEDRFQLKAHRESRESTVSILTVAKSGLRVAAFQVGDCIAPDPARPIAPPQPGQKPVCGAIRPGISGTNQTLESVGMTMPALVQILGSMLGRIVVDRTGITGPMGALHLEFVSPRLDAPANSDGPSIFTALQDQAGLKLDSEKASVEFLVIDRIEKPSEN
jgi:uncharacterized protein (TIGR03435 family)